MAKVRGDQLARFSSTMLRSRRKRETPANTNREFIRAFADALRDILQEERRRVA